ncbi:MAG: tRNA (adenosine(37)-N6)-threonylcarbamoyltransferase complex transferase subunit TsaD [Patescibacteria group bacterium]
MKVLGIETSCDETALAIVSDDKNQLIVEKSVVLSQVQEHAQYGGVVPEVAARRHLEAIFPMLQFEIPNNGKGIDVIAVTAGPGLAPALRTGVEVAKTLAWLWKRSLIGVSHLEGHIYANWLKYEHLKNDPDFPVLALIVSGGHTELILMKDHGQFERLGETLDDAAGEAYDKVGKMLGLPYPGGPQISKLAEGGDKAAFDFPRGLLDRPDLNFSFSGLKTSVLYHLRKNEDKIEDQKFRKDLAASFQEAVVDVLARKTKRAAEKVKPSSIIVAGGVAANSELRHRISDVGQDLEVPVYVPDIKYSTDNAAMIAAVGYFRAQDKKNFVDPLILRADPNLDIV